VAIHLVLERNQDKKLAVPISGSFYVDTKNKYAIPHKTNDQVKERVNNNRKPHNN